MDHLDLQNFYKFFARKAEQICKIYSLGQEQSETKFCSINSIKLTTMQKDKELCFYLHKDPNRIKGSLPKTIIRDKEYPKGEYSLICADD
ncbi:MAG TPA: hypothetical protein VMV86_04550, partial [Methanosarcinales archaeon]|nr:hypothetical protein [Methanosarcinales archaeon]